MAKPVGSIAIQLKAFTGQFQAKMKAAGQRVGKFGKKVSRLGPMLKKAAVAVAAFSAAVAAAAVGGIKRLIDNEFQAIDATAKLADTIGISTESLQAFRHAAQLNGASVKELDKGLEKMTRGIGEAQQGIGTAKQSFDTLGISLDQLAGRSPEEQFKVIADAIAGLEDRSLQAATANQIFGRSGIKLLNTLKLGADGLSQMEEEAKKLGIAYDRVDAAKVEQANDAMLRMGQAIQGVLNTLAIKLAPVVTGLVTELKAVFAEVGGGGQIIDNVIRHVIESVGVAVDIVNFFRGAWFGVQGAISAVIGSVVQLAASTSKFFQYLLNQVGLASHGFTEFNNQLQMIADNSFSEMEDSFKKSGELFGDALGGGTAKRFGKWLTKINNEAEKKAQETAKKAAFVSPSIAPPGSPAAKAAAKQDQSGTRTVSFAALALGSFFKKPNNPQVKEQKKANKFLKKIADEVKKPITIEVRPA